MSQAEKEEYDIRLIRWTEETMPRLFAIEDAWMDADVKDFDEGCIIASAFSKYHPFIPGAMRYEIAVRKKKLGYILCQIRERTELKKMATRPAVSDKRYLAILPSKKIDENGKTIEKKPFEMPEVSGRRPEHLSQYVHQLSPSLQKDAKNLESLYLQLASHKERALLLSENPNATKADIEAEVKKTLAAEAKILNFWEQVDLEWEKITGKEIDEEEMERLKAESERLNRQVVKSAGEYTKTEIDAMDDEEMQENCKKARIEANKKYLRRSDVQMTDERREQTVLRAKELLAWGIELSARAKETIEQNGIEVPGLSIEEKNEDIEL